MPASDEVHPQLRESLQSFLFRARSLSWPKREELAGMALDALLDADDLPSDLSPTAEYQKIVAAMIRDLGEPPVTEGEQAILYSLSASMSHRTAGEAWLEAHPEEAFTLAGNDVPVIGAATRH